MNAASEHAEALLL